MTIDKYNINIELTVQMGSADVRFNDFINMDIGTKIELTDTDETKMLLLVHNMPVGTGKLTAVDGKIAVALNKRD